MLWFSFHFSAALPQAALTAKPLQQQYSLTHTHSLTFQRLFAFIRVHVLKESRPIAHGVMHSHTECMCVCVKYVVFEALGQVAAANVCQHRWRCAIKLLSEKFFVNN